MDRFLRILLAVLFSLTIISIFLPFSPLFGQQKGTLFPWDTISGNLWKSFGDPRFLPEYKGETSNGKPNGVGILYNGSPNWSGNDKGFSFLPRCIYIGEWKNGNIHGQGIYTHNDGSKRSGIFKEGEDWETIWYGPLGNVIKTFSKGKEVLRQKYHGILFGQSKGNSTVWFQVNSNLTDGKYEGEIKNGQPNGMGKAVFNNGDKYGGNWIDGKLSGQGTYLSFDGRKYVGEFIKGKYHGMGTLTFSDGLKKIGEFKNGVDWNTKWYNPYGKIAGEYVNGILIK